MTKCTYCGNEMRQGTGKMFVFKNGKIAHFCSNKCEKNMFKLGRVARDYKWTEFYEKGAK
jgi:large subunit ribosomal protein L24e